MFGFECRVSGLFQVLGLTPSHAGSREPPKKTENNNDEDEDSSHRGSRAATKKTKSVRVRGRLDGHLSLLVSR